MGNAVSSNVACGFMTILLSLFMNKLLLLVDNQRMSSFQSVMRAYLFFEIELYNSVVNCMGLDLDLIVRPEHSSAMVG